MDALNTNEDDLRVVEFRARNVMGIRAVVIRPDEDGVVIGGRNRQGKTSTIDSLLATLMGRKASKSRMIREGQSRAETEVDLGAFVVRKTWTPRGEYLEVRRRDDPDRKVPRPQTAIDALLGLGGADLADLMALSPRDMASTVARVYGMEADLRENARKRAEVYEQRHDAKKERDRLAAKMESLPKPAEDAPSEPVDTVGLIGRLRDAQEKIRSNEKARLEAAEARQHVAQTKYECDREVSAYEARIRSLNLSIEDLEKRLEELKSELADANVDLEAKRQEKAKALSLAEKRAADLEKEAAALTDPDIAPIEDQLSRASEINQAVAQMKERESVDRAYEVAQRKAEDLEEAVRRTDAERAEIMAKSPIEGLEISEDGVSVNGVPFDGLSSTERIEFAIEVLVKANPRLKLMVIRDGSLLDEESLAAVKRKAVEHGFQPWIERVGDGHECDVIIEAGEIAEVRGDGV